MGTATGEICKRLSSSFEWRIKNFSSLSEEPGTFYESPPFDFYDATWSMKIYPGGLSKHYSEFVSLHLSKRSCDESKRTVVFHRISIKKYDGTDYVSHESTSRFPQGKYLEWGWKVFIKRSKLLTVIPVIAPDDILTITCIVRWNQFIAEASPEKISGKIDTTISEQPILWKSLVQNMKDFFLKQRNCDVVIKVKGEEFAAHKVILESRSKVFEAMFEHDMKENRDGIIEIDDSNPSVFREFLQHLYCGQLEKLSSENVYDLFALSDKYNIEDLKEECVKFMESKMSLETVCEVLFVSEKYGEAHLNELAKSFVQKNATSVLSSDRWKNFESENHQLAYQILKSVLLSNA